ncbi:MAG: PilX N-terminal domain-containing pilus assembly protein [Pseudomonadales bacterium]
MNSKTEYSQQGVALIVSLVILLVLTVAGVAAMQSNALQSKLATVGQERQRAFEGAEAALRLAERAVEEDPSGIYQNENHYNDCSSGLCFDEVCSGGRCFQGCWDTVNDPTGCTVVVNSDSSSCSSVGYSAAEREPWYDTTLNVWSNAGKHGTITVPGLNTAVKYITEFRCFVPIDAAAEMSESNATPLYRVTVRSISNSGRAEVMLQSTYMRVEN